MNKLTKDVVGGIKVLKQPPSSLRRIIDCLAILMHAPLSKISHDILQVTLPLVSPDLMDDELALQRIYDRESNKASRPLLFFIGQEVISQVRRRAPVPDDSELDDMQVAINADIAMMENLRLVSYSDYTKQVEDECCRKASDAPQDASSQLRAAKDAFVVKTSVSCSPTFMELLYLGAHFMGRLLRSRCLLNSALRSGLIFI